VNAIKQKTEPLIEANKEVSLEINAEKTKYMAVLASHQNADQNHNIKIAIRSFENLSKFKYFGTRVIN
jgi:hypothetical protein